eukprot:277566_1
MDFILSSSDIAGRAVYIQRGRKWLKGYIFSHKRHSTTLYLSIKYWNENSKREPITLNQTANISSMFEIHELQRIKIIQQFKRKEEWCKGDIADFYCYKTEQWHKIRVQNVDEKGTLKFTHPTSNNRIMNVHRNSEFIRFHYPPMWRCKKAKDKDIETTCFCSSKMIKVYDLKHAIFVAKCHVCHVQFAKNNNIGWRCINNKHNPYVMCRSCAIYFKDINKLICPVLPQELISRIALFAADMKLKYFVSLKRINKNWFKALNNNNSEINLCWKWICYQKFPNTNVKLNIKRWDKYFQYKLQQVNQHGKTWYSGEYGKYLVIENCDYDIKEINKFYTKPVMQIEYDIEEEQDQRSVINSEVEINGLPKGLKWKFKCPIVFDKLMYNPGTVDNSYWCNVCDKNVYAVKNEKELKERIKNDECVTFLMIDESKHKPPEIEQFQGGFDEL